MDNTRKYIGDKDCFENWQGFDEANGLVYPKEM